METLSAQLTLYGNIDIFHTSNNIHSQSIVTCTCKLFSVPNTIKISHRPTHIITYRTIKQITYVISQTFD